MSVIEFPGCETSLEDRSEDEIMQRPFAIWKAGSTTARSSIALQMVEPAIGGREDKHEKAMFAVFEVAKMRKKLKADYQAMWHGEKLRDQ